MTLISARSPVIQSLAQFSSAQNMAGLSPAQDLTVLAELNSGPCDLRTEVLFSYLLSAQLLGITCILCNVAPPSNNEASSPCWVSVMPQISLPSLFKTSGPKCKSVMSLGQIHPDNPPLKVECAIWCHVTMGVLRHRMHSPGHGTGHVHQEAGILGDI